MEKSEKKRIQILEAATYRLSHFGMAKTTMAEIAKDLSLSKGLLYYYFPDKNSLFAAVFEYVVKLTSDETKALVSGIRDPYQAMTLIVEGRANFIKKYYKLLEYSISIGSKYPTEIQAAFENAQREELSSIANVLHIGVDEGYFEIDDIEETASMLLYAIIGMRLSVLTRSKFSVFPTVEEFSRIVTLQKKLVTILLDGLRNKNSVFKDID